MSNSIISREIIKDVLIEKCIRLIVSSFNEIVISDRLYGQKPLEDKRRNQLVQFMKSNASNFKFKNIIATESGSFDEETFVTKGRIDICIYYSKKYRQSYLSFECKRFVKNNFGDIAFEDAYYTEGLSRYESKKYLSELGYTGMIAFLEEGDYGVLNTKIKKIIKKHSENGYIDESDYYNHRFVYSSVLVDSDRKSFIVKHILMSFV